MNIELVTVVTFATHAAAFIGGAVVFVGVPKLVAGFKVWLAAKEAEVYTKIASAKLSLEAQVKQAAVDGVLKL